jgi:hypothetical protein
MVLATWAALNEVGGVLDTGFPWTPGDVTDAPLFVQGTGNFDTNAVVTIQGSNDGTNWVPVGAATLTAAVLTTTIASRPRFIRPAVTTAGAGDATAVVVTICGTRRT